MAKDCPKCGAPHERGLILCKFCRAAFDEDEARRATPCPRCKDLFPEETQKCPRCDLWLVVQCVFCHALTPHQRPECGSCGEVFAGAPQRKAARDAAQASGGGLAWSTGPASGKAPGGGGGGFGDFSGWGAPPPPEQAASERFSSFGNNSSQPAAPDEKDAGWDVNSWAPRRK